MDKTKDYYAILGVLPTAEDVVIRAAYKVLAQRYHPDRTQETGPDASKRMALINEAYTVLSDPDKRKEYDALRSANSSTKSGIDDPNTTGAVAASWSPSSSHSHSISAGKINEHGFMFKIVAGIFNILLGIGIVIGSIALGIAWLGICFGSVILGVVLLIFAPHILLFPFGFVPLGVTLFFAGIEILGGGLSEKSAHDRDVEFRKIIDQPATKVAESNYSPVLWFLVILVVVPLVLVSAFEYYEMQQNISVSDKSPLSNSYESNTVESHELNIEPVIVDLELISVGLADRTYVLETELQLLVTSHNVQALIADHMPSVRNAVISLLVEKRGETLYSSEGKTQLAAEITAAINHRLSMIVSKAVDRVEYLSFVLKDISLAEKSVISSEPEHPTPSSISVEQSIPVIVEHKDREFIAPTKTVDKPSTDYVGSSNMQVAPKSSPKEDESVGVGHVFF